MLKLFYSWCPADWVEHEARISSLVSATGYPAPRILDRVEIGDRKGIVYERVEGESLLKTSIVRPWRLRGSARQLAELHAAMHGRAGARLPALRATLERAIRGSSELSEEQREGALEVLAGLPDGEALCHSDFHPDQVIGSARGPVVIDWMTAQAGNPLADVARTLVIITVGQSPGAGWAVRALIATWRRLFRRAYLARYLELRPESRLVDIHAWMVPVAAARLAEAIPGEDRALHRMIHRGLDSR